MADDFNQLLINEIRVNRELRNTDRAENKNTLKNIESILSKLLKVNKDVSERYVLSDYTISKDDFYATPSISSPTFERARIFVSIGFNENSTGGILIDLYYSGHRIGEVLKINPLKAGMSAGSESFDINRLSGFNFVIVNTDVGQEVKINSLKIVLYNE